jgi:SAM-dependent methyltransferase
VLARIIIAMDYDQSGIATTYDEARALTPARRRRWQRLLSAHVDRTAISLVVDLGCGTGRFSEMLATELGARVIGLDPSEKMIDQARAETGNEPCRIWAGVSTRASAHGRLRRSRVYVADLRMREKRCATDHWVGLAAGRS